jgi:hypothetical protein
MWSSTEHGYTVESLERRTLAENAGAVLQLDYGLIEGTYWTAPGVTPRANVTIPRQYTQELPNLLGGWVRIQELYDDGWRTVFCGRVAGKEDHPHPSAAVPGGTWRWLLTDALEAFADLPLRQHDYQSGEGLSSLTAASGHPGYNPPARDGRVLGNRAGSTLATYKHTDSGRGQLWTIPDALADALKQGRAGNPSRALPEITFDTSAAGALVDDWAAPWPVGSGESVLSVWRKILDPRRGVLAWLDWDEEATTGNQTTGTFALVLRIASPLAESLDAWSSWPADYRPASLPAAADRWAADIINDPTVAPGMFISEPLHANAVETFGDPVRLCWSTRLDDRATPTWTTSAQEDFANADNPDDFPALDGVWRTVRLDAPRAVSCADDGALTVATDTDASPAVCVLSGTLPVHLTSRKDDVEPGQLQPTIWRGSTLASDDWSEVNNTEGAGLAFSQGMDATLIEKLGDARLLEDNGAEGLWLTVAADQGERLRMLTTRADAGLPEDDGVTRVRRIEARGLAVHLVDYQTVLSIDGNGEPELPLNVSSEHVNLDPAAGPDTSTYYRGRDDRTAMAQLHARACTWYLVPRHIVRVPLFGTPDWSSFGRVWSTLTASGRDIAINTPITAMSYDTRTGSGMIATGWQDLDT